MTKFLLSFAMIFCISLQAQSQDSATLKARAAISALRKKQVESQMKEFELRMASEVKQAAGLTDSEAVKVVQTYLANKMGFGGLRDTTMQANGKKIPNPKLLKLVSDLRAIPLTPEKIKLLRLYIKEKIKNRKQTL